MPNPDPAARAAVAAWMESLCPHGPVTMPKRRCPDCLLAFAAAQRAEEREACAKVAWNIEPGFMYVGCFSHPSGSGNSCTPGCHKAIADLIRARREGPGGAQ